MLFGGEHGNMEHFGHAQFWNIGEKGKRRINDRSTWRPNGRGPSHGPSLGLHLVSFFLLFFFPSDTIEKVSTASTNNQQPNTQEPWLLTAQRMPRSDPISGQDFLLQRCARPFLVLVSP